MTHLNRPIPADAFPKSRFAAPFPTADKARVCFLDTETTGLDVTTDEVLQLAIILLDGTVAYSGYFKPTHTDEWPGAEKVNHISPSALKDKPALLDERGWIEGALADCNVVVGWNVLYDLEMLYAGGIDFPENVMFCDLMPAFCDAWRVGHPRYPEDRQRERLTRVTHWLGIEHDAHDALGDTEVLVPIWDWVVERVRG